jgi:glucose/mannose transport system permease protein
MTTVITASVTPPLRRRRTHLAAGRIGLYLFLIISALFFLAPLYVMIITSFKPMAEIQLGNILALPRHPTLAPWRDAWTLSCSGLTCGGLRASFLNSVNILVPSVILSVMLGALTGYTLSFWHVRGASILFTTMMIAAFVPYQIFIYPMVRWFALIRVGQSLATIITVHIIFSLPTLTLLFRNYFATLPKELFNAARVDGAGFFRIFWSIILPMSTPMITVAGILQVTGVWNDFIFGLIFAGHRNMPMMVQLNNMVNSDQGEKLYNVDMAATMITALLPLVVYFVSGRWFVRGIAAGAVKG